MPPGRGAGSTANGHDERQGEESAIAESGGDLVGGDHLKARRGERRDDHEQAAAQEGEHVIEGRQGKGGREDEGHDPDPKHHRLRLDVAEKREWTPLPHLGVNDKADGAQNHEHHENRLKGEGMVVHDGKLHGRETAGHEPGGRHPQRVQEGASGLHAHEQA